MLDSTTISILLSKFLVGLMIFLRVSGFLFASPMFQQTAIISQVKVMFGILLTLILTTAFWQEQPNLELNPLVLAILAFKEIMIGVAIGYSAQLVFFAARFAGGLIDFDMGYHTSILFDPASTTPTLIGELKELIVLMVFLLINGHHYLLESLLISMRAVPIGTFAVTESTVKLLGEFATSIFIVAIKISAPVLLSLFITNVALALLARIAPQTNIFVLSFQLKVAVGVIVLFITVSFFIYAAKFSLENFQELTMKILLSLNPGRV